MWGRKSVWIIFFTFFLLKIVILRSKWTKFWTKILKKWLFITSFRTAYVSFFSYLPNHISLWLKYLSKISQKFLKIFQNFRISVFLKVSQKRTCLFEALAKAKNNLAHTITIILKGDLFYELFILLYYLYYYIRLFQLFL